MMQPKATAMDCVLSRIDYRHLSGKARTWYQHNADNRYYHNWEHAAAVVDNIYRLTKTPSDALIIAAYWHDAVYVPRTRTGTNEHASAIALVNTAERAGIHSKVIQDAHNLIVQTDIASHLIAERLYGDIAVLLDSDLNSLALPYDRFVDKQRDIIQENVGNPFDPGCLNKCAVFLTQFIECRENIYHTDAARDLWEEKARENITRLAKEYQ